MILDTPMGENELNIRALYRRRRTLLNPQLTLKIRDAIAAPNP